MAERRCHRVVVAWIGLALALFAACNKDDHCDQGTCTSQSPTRLLDVLCDPQSSKPGCDTSGDVEWTTGVTEDTLGVHFGHGGGSLSIHLARVDATAFAQGTFDVEILVAAVDRPSSQVSSNLTWGSCNTGCPPDPPPLSSQAVTDYAWVTVVRAENTAPAAGTLPDDALLTVTGKDIDIADIRTVSSFPAPLCSIAGPIGAR